MSQYNYSTFSDNTSLIYTPIIINVIFPASGGINDDEDDSSGVRTLQQLDPRLLVLKKRLQSKRELLKHLQKMLDSFAGDNECCEKYKPTHTHTHMTGVCILIYTYLL